MSAFPYLVNIGTTDWNHQQYHHQFENPTPSTVFGYQSDRNVMYSIPDFIVDAFKSPL
jgi:hypothetical protein